MGDRITENAGTGPLHLVLVCGAMASGKSTFCTEWVRARNPTAARRWQRVSQDDLVALSSHAAAAEVVLRLRKENVIIDRVCSDAGQRKAFLKLARKAGALCHCIVLRPPLETCVAQLRRRGDDHPRFPCTPETLHTLRKVYKAFDMPQEGDFASLTLVTTEAERCSALRLSLLVDCVADTQLAQAQASKRATSDPFQRPVGAKRPRLDEESICRAAQSLSLQGHGTAMDVDAPQGGRGAAPVSGQGQGGFPFPPGVYPGGAQGGGCVVGFHASPVAAGRQEEAGAAAAAVPSWGVGRQQGQELKHLWRTFG